MYKVMNAWEIASNVKFANDLVLVARRRKSPLQIFVRTMLDNYAKQVVYTSWNYYRK